MLHICIPVFLWLLTAMGMIVPGGYGVATGGPFAWGLCYNREMSPMQSYCDDYYKYIYPCSPGAEYYGRGALPIYWFVFHLFYHWFMSISFHNIHISELSFTK